MLVYNKHLHYLLLQHN